jgi:hypothetical protein
MREVFMPTNLRLEALIVQNADLLDGTTMPKGFQLLLAHVAGYKAVLKSWDQGDFSQHASVIPFPRQELESLVTEVFLGLKREQVALLGHEQSR